MRTRDPATPTRFALTSREAGQSPSQMERGEVLLARSRVVGMGGFDVLYRGQARAVYSFLWRLGAREADTEDLVHDVFLTAARRWSSYDPKRPVRPWLLGIALRVHSEARRRARPLAELPELVDRALGPDETVAQVQARKLLQRTLATLPEQRRTAFVLHELEGLSVKEVSDAMECPAQTTYSRLTLARAEVEKAFDRYRPRSGSLPTSRGDDAP